MASVTRIVSGISKLVKKLEVVGNFHADKSDYHSEQAVAHHEEAVRAQSIRLKIADLISG